MIDAHDFTRWVRTQDTRLAPVLQGLFDLYIRGRDNRARTTKPENVDSRHMTGLNIIQEIQGDIFAAAATYDGEVITIYPDD